MEKWTKSIRVMMVLSAHFSIAPMTSLLPMAQAQNHYANGEVHASNASPALTAPFSGYCLNRTQHAGFEIKQKKASGFFKIKTGVFCTTPVVAGNGNLITGCDDGFIRFVSDQGALVRSISIDHDPNAGVAPNPEVVAIPNTLPEQFVATSSVDRLILRFDIHGKIISKMKMEADLGKPVTLKNGSYFVADSDGVGRLYGPLHSGNPVLFETRSPYLNTPSIRTSPSGQDQIVISDDRGTVFILSESGQMETIKVSSAPLGPTQISPRGQVWVSDSGGIMHILSIGTQGMKTQTLKTINMGKGEMLSRPIFLKNGRITFGSGNLIFIFNENNLEQPEAIYDSRIGANDYQSGISSRYAGSPMKQVDLAVMVLEDGKEYIWVPAHGGYHLINDQGALAGMFSYGKGLGDAETFSTPIKLKDGTFTLGMFYGIDRVTVRKSPSLIPSGSWVTCDSLQ